MRCSWNAARDPRYSVLLTCELVAEYTGRHEHRGHSGHRGTGQTRACGQGLLNAAGSRGHVRPSARRAARGGTPGVGAAASSPGKEDLSLSGDVPEPTDRTPTITKGHTGVTASDVKTRPTDRSPEQFIEELEWPRRVEHGRELLALFNQVTDAEPVMWGPTMIGYGEVHYVSPAGREGDWFQLGFSPRKASLSLYGLQGAPRSEELLAKLGKHKRGAGCVYVNKLEDIDMDVLAELVQHAWESDAQDC